MLNLKGRSLIYSLRQTWMILNFVRAVLVMLSVLFLLIALDSSFPGLNKGVLFLLFGLAVPAVFYFNRFWKIMPEHISSYLDQHFPQLEESSGLFLRSPGKLSILQQLQVQKLDREIENLRINWLKALRFKSVFLWLMFSGLLGVSLLLFKHHDRRGHTLLPSKALSGQPVKEVIPTGVSSVSIDIAAPAYTNVAPRNQQHFSLKAERGSKVTWTVNTTRPVKKMYLIFDDRNQVQLRSLNVENTAWSLTKKISGAGFYQLEMDETKSDLYQIELIPDLPVHIKITSPEPNSTIDAGMPANVNLKVLLTDDYGINNAFITATMASGKGEGVSFTEKKLSFNVKFGNQRSLSISKQIDLKSLGMKPGDELYFFISATDNQGQTSRSDVFIVSLVDTAELMSMSGMSTGINLVPEYFRSQRQIIIDTEKLLKEKGDISEKEFKDRSNEIGVDQKLLRLRYGKFLGEESETEIGADHDHEEEEGHAAQSSGSEGKTGDVREVMDQYAHKHDIAEDATFFEPELKAQLKAVLTEMWSSELKLRTYFPKEALPFEYKALRLLKDLQQKSRVYVAKTTIKATQLKDEKRFSGALDKIAAPLQRATYKNADRKTEELRRALAILESAKINNKLGDEERLFLISVEKYVLEAATGNSASYLAGLKSFRKITSWLKVNDNDISAAEAAIKKMIPTGVGKPVTTSGQPGKTLSQSYFNNLNQTGS